MPQHNIPQLRFPEFSEAWEEKKLGEYLEFKNGINASKQDYGKGYKFINVLDIINNNFILHDCILGRVNISKEIFFKNIVEYGDILFQRSSETREEVGQSNVYLDKDKNATFGGFVIRGKSIKKYDPAFINYLLKTTKARQEITSKSGGSTRYNIGQETLRDVSICLPFENEQVKIALFLSATDKKIEQLQQKMKLLEMYKKGMMQKLFSQQVRFKDKNGSEFPKWEEKSIIEITSVIVGGTPSTTNKRYWNGSIGWLSSGDVNKGIIYKPTKWITLEGLNNSSAKLMPANTVLLAMTGATLGKIGFLTFECSGNQSIAGFIPTGSFYSPYLYYILKYNTNRILSLAGGGAQSGINKSTIESLTFNFPNIEEQTKIADFLTAIDAKINIISAQFKKAEKFKKGLLQQMFV